MSSRTVHRAACEKSGGAPRKGLRRRIAAPGPAPCRPRGQYLYFIHLSSSRKVGFLPYMKMPTR